MRRHHPVVALLPLLASCSLIFVRAPDPNPPCTDDYVLPVADGVAAAASVLTMVLGAIGCRFRAPDDRTGCHVAEAGFGAGTALFVTSSIIGSRRVSRCKTALIP